MAGIIISNLTNASVILKDLSAVSIPSNIFKLDLTTEFDKEEILRSNSLKISFEKGELEVIYLDQNYSDFRLLMMVDPGWSRIKKLGDSFLISEVTTTLSFMSTNLQALKYKWNELIESLNSENKPTTVEKNAWNTYVTGLKLTNNYVPDNYSLNFDSYGKLF